MGCVYRAHDTRLNNVVAVKKMLCPDPDSGDSEYMKQRFREEATLLSQLHSGGLPKVIDFFSEPDRETGCESHYLVMTFIEGNDLETLLDERGGMGMPLSEILDCFRQILSILKYLHSRLPPVVYRDLKPSNIMISNGKLFLVDFGIARIFQPSQKGTAIGTPGYAAPEQFTGYAEPRSDIYSLGAVIHYLLTSIDPEDPAHQLFHFEDPCRLKPETPRYLGNLVMSMVESAPEKRPASVDKIAEALELSGKTEFSMKRVFKKAGLGIAIAAPALALVLAMRTSFDSLDRRGDIRPPAKAAARMKQPPPPVDPATVPKNLPPPPKAPAQSPPQQPSISRDILDNPLKARQALAERHLDYNEKTFLVCAGKGDFQAVQLYLASGMNAGTKDDKGRTALSLAAQWNQFQTADWLIKKGADINTADCYHTTALKYALSSKGPETAGLLIQSGADLSDGSGLLSRAAERGYTDIVKLLISRKVKVDPDVKTREMMPPLHCALDSNNAEVAKLLINAGASVGSRDSGGYTPLCKAAGKGFADIAEMLIRKGADVNAASNSGISPLYAASEKNDTKIMELLIYKGADANVKNEAGRTPLHWACIHGNKGIAELLLSKRADINARDRYKRTPLLDALAYSFPDIAKMLIARGADINTVDESIGSPLHMSLYCGDKLTSFLVSHGARIDSRNRDGSTPLHMAALNGYPEDVKCLLDHGAEVNAKDNRGCTPLKIAIKGKNADKITLLRNAGGIE